MTRTVSEHDMAWRGLQRMARVMTAPSDTTHGTT